MKKQHRCLAKCLVERLRRSQPGSQLPTRTGKASLACLILKKKESYHLDPDWASYLLTKQLLSHVLGKFLSEPKITGLRFLEFTIS